MDFTFKENDDGSFELFNTIIGDIYFSNIGAYKEAMQKFVLPSVIDFQKLKKIKILDACYGMGYNSKSFVNYVLKNNYDCEIQIDAVDIDKNILAFSLFLMDENIENSIHVNFGRNLIKQINLDENIKKLSGEKWIKKIVSNILIKNEDILKENNVVLHHNSKITQFLHNIYYQNYNFLKEFYSVSFFNSELSFFIKTNSEQYDLIFHDAFSILKQPGLWTKDIMQNYYKCLNQGGKLLTYSNSRQLRRILTECGFEVIVNTIGERKQNGTIAIKS